MIAEAESSIKDSIHYKVRQESIMLNPEHHMSFLQKGWFVAKNVVKEQEISAFQKAYNRITVCEGFELTDQFLNTGCMVNEEIRSVTMDVVREQEAFIFPRIFDMNLVEPKTGGSFVVKPPHENSELSLHQDASFIDEEKAYSLFVWVPFTNVGTEDGPMWALPGSHLWGNTQRGFGVPWPFEKHKELMNDYLEPITVNAGDVVVFDPAVIHSSTPNFSDKLRNAIMISAVRKNPQVVYYFQNKELGENDMEVYNITEEFFKDYDFVSKPDESKWSKYVVPYKNFECDKEEMKSMIERFLPKNQR